MEEDLFLRTAFYDYSPRLVHYAEHFVASREVAQDIVQECYVHLWEKRGSLDFSNLKGLLFTMVRNSCLNYIKHQQYVLQRRTYLVERLEGQELLYNLDFEVESSTPELLKEMDRQVDQLLEQLPPRCRQVFVMSRMEGLKNREIAEKLHISTTSVEKHIRRALAEFSVFFGKKDYLKG